jgi:hypothetical protein
VPRFRKNGSKPTQAIAQALFNLFLMRDIKGPIREAVFITSEARKRGSRIGLMLHAEIFVPRLQ